MAEIRVDLRTDIKKSLESVRTFSKTATKSLGRLETSFNKGNTSVKKTNASFKQLTKTVQTQGSAVNFLKARILPLIAAYAGLNVVRGVAKNFLSFEKALAEVNTIIDPTIISNEELKKTLISTSQQFGTSAADQAKAFYAIILQLTE